MNYEEARAALKAASRLGSRPGLYSIGRLCSLLGNPQDAVKTVHVAGTNGKGSVCAMIASVLQTVGLKTGLFISPAIEEYRDGLMINGTKISKGDFARIFSVVYDKVVTLSEEEVVVTEFEMIAACAFEWFRDEGCDVAVIETGMGGRLDATNVIKKPLVSVITSISIDHTEYLGPTVEQIAKEKCGIIKPKGVTVSYPRQIPAAMSVIELSAQENANMLVVPDMEQLKVASAGFEGTRFAYCGREYSLSLAGAHQTLNAVTAIETAETLREQGFLIPDEAVAQGLRSAYLPARQEVIHHKPLIVLDGAHNVQGISALADTVKRSLYEKKISVVMGMLRDKQYEPAIALMATLCGAFFAVRPQSSRALGEDEAAMVAARHCEKVSAYDDYTKALKTAAEFCGENGAIIICGSFYLEAGMRKAEKSLFEKTEVEHFE